MSYRTRCFKSGIDAPGIPSKPDLVPNCPTPREIRKQGSKTNSPRAFHFISSDGRLPWAFTSFENKYSFFLFLDLQAKRPSPATVFPPLPWYFPIVRA